MADAADMMDARVRRMQVEKWVAIQLPAIRIQKTKKSQKVQKVRKKK